MIKHLNVCCFSLLINHSIEAVQFTPVTKKKKKHVLPFTNPREIIFKDRDSQKSLTLTSPVYSVGSGTSLTAKGNQHSLFLTIETKLYFVCCHTWHTENSLFMKIHNNHGRMRATIDACIFVVMLHQCFKM